MRYAFTFDASACTGCKSCQVACKDKNALDLGVLWRRVYEVSGGTWERKGAAWTNTVFAYNVSVGCNHCADPSCATACPADAYVIREDGIVWLDEGRCLGCQYCAWACPYGAPQYSESTGRTTKCDFCKDLLDQGLPPACVASCPMRALDVTRVDDAEGASDAASSLRTLWHEPGTRHPFPMPAASHTRPRLAIAPHRAMANALPKDVANREEVGPAASHRDVPSLVAFTLLAQAAAGTAVVSWVLGAPLDRTVVLIIGVLTVLAAAASLLHLGTVSRAWRAPAHAGTSALSREVLALVAFGALNVTAWFAPSAAQAPLAIAGIALVVSMVQVYRLDVVPGWTAWRTAGAFATTTVVLGVLAVTVMAGRAPHGAWLPVTATAIVVQQLVSRMRFYRLASRKPM